MGRQVGSAVIQHAGKVEGVGEGNDSWDHWVPWMGVGK